MGPGDPPLHAYLALVHHAPGGLLVGAPDHVSDLHPAAVTDAPLIRLHLLPVFNEPRLPVTVTWSRISPIIIDHCAQLAFGFREKRLILRSACLTRLVQVFSARKLLQLDVSQVARLRINGGFGELVLKGLKVLGARRALLRLGEHSDNPVAAGRRANRLNKKATTGLRAAHMGVLLPGADHDVSVRQDAAAPDGLGRQADGLRTLAPPPYPQRSVLSGADEICRENIKQVTTGRPT